MRRILQAVSEASETAHIKSLIRLSDNRGSDVNVVTGELRDSSVQVIPYPAFVWQWRPKQSYSWHNAQHINA